MKKRILYNIVCAGVVMLSTTALVGCGDSFLEKEPNGGVISNEQMQELAVWNPYILLGQNYGITFKSLLQGTGGTTQHDDFGQKSVDLTTDILSGDIAMPANNYGWFRDAAQLLATKTTDNRAYMVWRYYYQIIKAANSVFDVIGGDESAPEDGENRIYYGQAKANRAYAYFNLITLHTKSYAIEKGNKALPIYRSQLTTENKGLSTVEEVFRFIIGDLEDAITCLKGYSRPISSGKEFKFEVNENVAKGILAYVYLTMGENAKAAQYAQDVINTEEFALLPKTELISNGFNNVNSQNWMWGIDLNKDNTMGLATFWGQMDLFTYSYAAAGDPKLIDDNLASELMAHEKDMRYYWFCDLDGSVFGEAGFYGYPINKFYDAGREPMGDRQWENDEVFMRVEEMYLIAAEGYARVGGEDLDAAKEIFTAFIEQRDGEVAAAVSDMSQDELLEAIYYNWRIEMWGEGKALLTMKRFQKTVTLGQSNKYHPNEQLSWDDERLTFTIPQRETSNNPLLEK
ncbi:RagB/SusD family nutrient uptake outer membrane protein [Bacteroides sp.]